MRPLTAEGQTVSAIVVNWKAARFIPALLDSLREQAHRMHEIFFIDNNSNDGAVEMIKERYPEVSIIVNSENRGYSSACNQGIRSSKGDWILILNPDVKLHAHYVEETVRAGCRDPRIGAVCGKILRFDGGIIDTTGQFLAPTRAVIDRGYSEEDGGQYDREGYVFSICGAVGLYRRRMLEGLQVDGEIFDEDFFAFYEDMDLMWRAQNCGWRAYYTPLAIGYHVRGGTNSPRGPHPRFMERYEFARRPRNIQRHILMNRYLMMVKNDRFIDSLKYLPFIIAYEIFLWLGILILRPSLVADFFKGRRLFMRAIQKRKAVQKLEMSQRWDCSSS